MPDARKGAAAIVGTAESDLGVVAEGLSPIDLMAQAIVRAAGECGLSAHDIDGLFCAATQLRAPALMACEVLRISPRIIDGTNLGGASFLFHLARACEALAAGLCDVAAIAYGSTQRSVGRKNFETVTPNPYESPFRPLLPVTAYALAAARHMHEFGTTREDLAAVAVAARQWALLNESAWESEPLTIEDVLCSRMISYPLTRRDCCLVTDGGGAIIVTRADRARFLRKNPVYVLGYGGVVSHQVISQMPDLVRTQASESSQRAFMMAGVRPDEVDVAQLYDAFTIGPILFLEDLGFCEKGEGGRFVSEGNIAPGGALPMNTNGGGLSYGHPGMFGIFTLIEATRQLRGECAARQVPDCDVAVAHACGGVLASHATVVLGTDTTL